MRPRSIDARIPRDLETIVLKAIEKDPKARYQSAEAMGEDLRRFLADEPIVARPVLFWERGLKWSRRRPALAASFGLVNLLLAGMLGLGVWSYVKISQALETAQGERRKADLERKAALAAARNEAAARARRTTPIDACEAPGKSSARRYTRRGQTLPWPPGEPTTSAGSVSSSI